MTYMIPAWNLCHVILDHMCLIDTMTCIAWPRWFCLGVIDVEYLSQHGAIPYNGVNYPEWENEIDKYKNGNFQYQSWHLNVESAECNCHYMKPSRIISSAWCRRRCVGGGGGGGGVVGLYWRKPPANRRELVRVLLFGRKWVDGELQIMRVCRWPV